MSKRKPHPPSPPPADRPCPCGHGTYGRCCGRLHAGLATAATAEELMRSRYSAFAVGDAAYLLRSWHPDTRPDDVELDPETEWVRLDVVGTSEGTPFHKEGTVEFRALYREHGRDHELREHSRFRRHEGAWVYLDALGD
ncbi:YchJ family metal-binding protein [Nocardiopsis sp. NPDC007018]|uniref:YchJ family protein n=1 Tax=Nocardiopsis sp. NPDC007018 TaxID=3155721 RepID=UPI003401146C